MLTSACLAPSSNLKKILPCSAEFLDFFHVVNLTSTVKEICHKIIFCGQPINAAPVCRYFPGILRLATQQVRIRRLLRYLMVLNIHTNPKEQATIAPIYSAIHLCHSQISKT
jgi:hypothetical protein